MAALGSSARASLLASSACTNASSHGASWCRTRSWAPRCASPAKRLGDGELLIEEEGTIASTAPQAALKVPPALFKSNASLYSKTGPQHGGHGLTQRQGRHPAGHHPDPGGPMPVRQPSRGPSRSTAYSPEAAGALRKSWFGTLGFEAPAAAQKAPGLHHQTGRAPDLETDLAKAQKPAPNRQSACGGPDADRASGSAFVAFAGSPPTSSALNRQRQRWWPTTSSWFRWRQSPIGCRGLRVGRAGSPRRLIRRMAACFTTQRARPARATAETLDRPGVFAMHSA